MEIDSVRKNRIVILTLVLALCVGLFSACKNGNEKVDAKEKKYQIVCTIFPAYDWVKNVVGDLEEDYDITFLLDKGVDLHNYQPTVEDMAKISECDVFVYVGGESDTWVESALEEANNKQMQVINLLDCLGDSAKEEELVEGMQGEEDDEADEADEEEGPEYDEHVWLSLKNAKVFVNEMERALSKLDPSNETRYQENAKNYADELDALDQEFQDTVDEASIKTVLFGDRFPFRYLIDDYNLDYYAAFIGCSAETEASFETVTFLANKVDELSLKHILVIENSDQKIAKTIIENTAAKDMDILVLDSMQSTTREDVKKGTTYLGIMKDNLEVLKIAGDNSDARS